MTRLTTALLAMVFLSTTGCVETTKPEVEHTPSKTRIGIYDSRAIAVAFIGSEVYKTTAGKKMADMMAAYKKAASEGDQKKVAELKAWGEAQQALLHKQAFRTAPVDNILKNIADQLPDIKKQAGVEMLVSKWDTKALEKQKSADQIDVTILLIETFRPTEKQKKSAIGILKHKPVPLKK